jgi:membrane fusion protein, multidrug efflux system
MFKFAVWLGLLVALAASGCAESQSQAATQAALATGKVTNVEVTTVVPRTFTEYITLPVVVNPFREVNLSLVNGGKVSRLLADKGDRVAAGRVLLETDTAVTRATLDLAVANCEFQQGEFDRNRQLFEAGSIPQSAFDAAKLALAQARSQRDIAQQQYDDATLEAPFAGTITMRNVEVGDVLGPAAPAFRLIDVSRVKIQAGIPERFIGDFRLGSTVTVALDAIPGRQFSGQMNYLAPEATDAVRTFLGEIVIDNREGLIRAGTMGNARIQRRTFPEAVVVPLDALIETQSGRKAFVVQGDTVAAERAISVEGSGDDVVVVAAGLRAGERVVTKGQHQIVDGDRVRVTGEYRQPAFQEVPAR